MKTRKIIAVILTALTALCLFAGCSSSGDSGTVSTDGSTSMSKVIGALGEAFEADNSGAKFTYNPTGSGSGIKAVLEGTTAIALSESDYVAAAKILNEFAEGKDYFEVKSGFIDGEVITVEKVKSLAKLPSKEGLIAKALGSLKAPITNLVYALNAIKDKKSEEEAA